MNKHGKRKVNGRDLKNEQVIDQIFRDLMNFPDWENGRLDQWIDMVSLTDPANPAHPRFHASAPESYVIELHDIDLPSQQHHLTSLIRRIAVVNKRYQARMGRPIISLTIF